MASGPRPRRSIVPGRKPSISASAFSTSSIASAIPSGRLRSTAIDGRERCSNSNFVGMSMPRSLAVVRSMRTTSAPRSGRDRCRRTRQYECPREAPSCFNLLRVCSLQTAKRVTLMSMALLKRFHYRPAVAAALGKLMRATAFRLTLVYLLVFIIFAVSLLAYFALNTRRLITDQITNRVNLEVNVLREQYEAGGIRRLETILDLRARRPGSSLYLLTTPSGEGLAGNVSSLEPGVLDHEGWFESSYRRIE